MKFKDRIFDIVKGFFVGTALLIPGVSAATIALITKIYDKLTTNIANLAKHFWSSFKVLIPIGIGVAIALASMWKPLQLATEHILFAIICLFAGSVIGSIPGVVDNIKGAPIKKRYFLYLLLAIICGMSFGILSYHCGLDVSQLFNPIEWKLYLIMIPIGFLAAAGVVVPGVSGSMLLLVLGFYKPILDLTHQIKENAGQVILVLLSMAIGVILGMFCFSKLMKCLLTKFKTATFIWIIGLVVGSIFSLFYNYEVMNYYHHKGIVYWEAILGVILLVIGFVGSYFLVLYQRKHQTQKNI